MLFILYPVLTTPIVLFVSLPPLYAQVVSFLLCLKRDKIFQIAISVISRTRCHSEKQRESSGSFDPTPYINRPTNDVSKNLLVGKLKFLEFYAVILRQFATDPGR